MDIRVKKIFIKILGKKVKINSKSDINNTIGWDSLNHIKIINELENVKKKKLSTTQFLEMTNVKLIEQFLKK
jgi:acyl carrier protein